jgi:uncharacterized protein (TIGR01777 family)
MRVILAGGTGQLGRVLEASLTRAGHAVQVLARHPPPGGLRWDGRSLGPWAEAVDGADAVINLAGRSVDCRYTEENLRQMHDSRVDSTRVLGEAIARARRPPRVWLQMGTATLYAHRFDAPNDEATGLLGGEEPDAPASWKRSVAIARAWEAALEEAPTPHTRKVLLRTAMVMGRGEGGVLSVLLRLVRGGLGGPAAGGRQWVSWLHEEDFARAVAFLLAREDLSGPFNLAAPEPLPHRDFMASLRRAAGVRVGLPASRWMLEVGAWVLRTDTELLLKSRRVVPGRLLAAGFRFRHPSWPAAAASLVCPPAAPSRAHPGAPRSAAQGP